MSSVCTTGDAAYEVNHPGTQSPDGHWRQFFPARLHKGGRLADFSVLQMADWPTAPAGSAEQLAASRATALALGARQHAGSGFICSCFNSCLRPFCLG